MEQAKPFLETHLRRACAASTNATGEGSRPVHGKGPRAPGSALGAASRGVPRGTGDDTEGTYWPTVQNEGGRARLREHQGDASRAGAPLGSMPNVELFLEGLRRRRVLEGERVTQKAPISIAMLKAMVSTLPADTYVGARDRGSRPGVGGSLRGSEPPYWTSATCRRGRGHRRQGEEEQDEPRGLAPREGDSHGRDPAGAPRGSCERGSFCSQRQRGRRFERSAAGVTSRLSD